MQCTKQLAATLFPNISGLRRNRTFESFEALLQVTPGGESLGLVWMQG